VRSGICYKHAVKVKKEIRVLFIANLPVPNGLAATNRLLSLAKGIAANGQHVSIFILNPTERRNSIKNFIKQGMIEDVNFRYLSPSTVLPANSLLKFFSFLYGALNLLLKIGFTPSKKLPDVIIKNLLERIKSKLPHLHIHEKKSLPKLLPATSGFEAAALGVAILPLYTRMAPLPNVLMKSNKQRIDPYN